MPFKRRKRCVGRIPKHCRVPSRTAGASANSATQGYAQIRIIIINNFLDFRLHSSQHTDGM
jgi:hypothetical protein